MASTGKLVSFLARARTALGARKSFSVLAVAAIVRRRADRHRRGGGGRGSGPRATAAAIIAAASRTGPPGDETTGSQNDLRDGWDPNEPTLTQAAVQGGQFGQIFKTAVNGQVYAQPLVIGNTLIVATENDWVYGLNATTGAILWSTSLGTAYHITSCDGPHPEHRHHLDAGVRPEHRFGVRHGDGQGGQLGVPPVRAQRQHRGHHAEAAVAGHPSNDSHITFHPIPQDQRTGLLLLNGWVYAAFASHCDHKPYAGYVSGVDVEQRPVKSTLWTDEAGVSDDQAGIWQSDGGLMSDGSEPDLLHLRQRHLPGQGPRRQAAGPARGVRGPAAAPVQRGLRAAGLLQPGERAQARRGRQGLRLRQPGRAPVRHVHLPGHRRPGGQVRPAVPAQPQRPRRPPAELRRRGRGPVRDRPPRRACGALPGSSATRRP